MSAGQTAVSVDVERLSRRAADVVLDLAVADVDGAVGVRGDVGLVRDEDDRVAGLVQALEERP